MEYYVKIGLQECSPKLSSDSLKITRDAGNCGRSGHY